ncbi:MAG: hypothetical protein IPJ79_01110 [Bacteroidetes bacterium]|nr:hypothetical protein [Bacteroidota bacterium]
MFASAVPGTCNLICNSNFNSVDFCPQQVPNLGRDLINGVWQSEASTCWYNPIATSTDLIFTFNCNSANGTSPNYVPNSQLGCENDHSTPVTSDQAYAGISTIHNPVSITYREYLQQQLSTPLIAGTIYRVSFWVSLSEFGSSYANNLGIDISPTAPLLIPNTWVLNAVPEISSVGNGFGQITNRTGWTQIWGLYTATGVERFITIGSFENNSMATYLGFSSNPPCGVTTQSFDAYYFIDDISIIPNIITSTISSQPNCGTTSNGSLTVTVSGGASPYDYLWSNGTTISNTASTTSTISNLTNGIYTVTITDANNCTIAVSGTVLGSSTPLSVTITPTGTLNPACGSTGSMTLTANPAGSTAPYTYQWSTGATTQTISVTTMGTRTVTVTSNVGCVANASYTVPEPGTAPLTPTIVGPISRCSGIDNNPAQYTLSPFQSSLLANYTITVTGGSVTTALNSSGQFSVTWAGTNTGGTINVSVTDNGCTSTNNLFVADCCRPTGATVISNTTSNNLVFSGGTYSSNTTLAINGTLTLTGPLTFLNSANIVFGAGARIINNGYTLTISDCNLRSGCNNLMWQGIVLGGTGQLIIPTNQATGTTIADAVYAISASRSSIVRADRVTFNRNYIGITINDAVTLTRAITRCTFNGNSGALLAAAPFTTFVGSSPTSRGFAGIYTQIPTYVDLTNPTGINGNNLFNELCYGLVATGGTVAVRNSVFQNIQLNTYPAVANISSGIFYNSSLYPSGSISNVLTQVGFGRTSTPSFNNCERGITMSGGFPNITDNNMVAMQTGIELGGVYGGGNTEITRNNISCSRFGLRDLSSGANSIAQVNYEDNLISFHANVAGVTTGIAISNVIPLQPAPQLARDNSINMVNAVNGITVVNSNTAQIYENTITMNGATNINGIAISRSTGVQVVDNTITASTLYNAANGINLITSSTSLVQCNDIDNVGSNVRVTSTSSGTVFRANTMRRGQFGLFLNAPMGLQRAQGNLWSTSSGNYTSLLAANANAAAVAGTRFEVKTASPSPAPPSGFTYSPPTLSPSSGWFFSTGVNPQHCSALSSRTIQEYIINPDSLYKDNFDTLTAADSLIDYSFEPEVDWTVKKKLYEKLTYNSYLLTSDSLMQAFKTTQTSLSIGRLVNLQLNIDSLPNATITNDTTASNLLADIQINATMLDSMVSMLRSDTLSSADSLTLVNAIDSVYNLVTINRNLCDSLSANSNSILDS